MYVHFQIFISVPLRRRFDEVYFLIILKVLKSLSIYCSSGVLFLMETISVRGSCLDVFCKKGLPRNFAKVTGKHQSQSLNKVAGLRPAAL